MKTPSTLLATLLLCPALACSPSDRYAQDPAAEDATHSDAPHSARCVRCGDGVSERSDAATVFPPGADTPDGATAAPDDAGDNDDDPCEGLADPMTPANCDACVGNGCQPNGCPPSDWCDKRSGACVSLPYGC